MVETGNSSFDLEKVSFGTMCDRTGLFFSSSSAPIGRYTLIRDPQSFGRRSTLIKDINRNTSSGIPIASNPQPRRLRIVHNFLSNGQCTIFVKGAVVAETPQVQFQRFAFHQSFGRCIINDKMGKVGLSSHGADRSKFRHGEAGQVQGSGTGVGDTFQDGFVGTGANGVGTTKLRCVRRRVGHAHCKRLSWKEERRNQN